MWYGLFPFTPRYRDNKGDLDGDGADELVLVDTVKDKLQVFKIQ
jgi:hypothetical protein